MNYYNEIDKPAAHWLRSLISANRIPIGTVDERSIADVQPANLAGFEQCHFFAGIGGWPYALHLANWPKGREVWTGSCPCQPFSSAGKQRGTNDARHVWPEFYRLIRERQPATIFGEQVASQLRIETEGSGHVGGMGQSNGTGSQPWRQATTVNGHGSPTEPASRLSGLAVSNGSESRNGELQRGGGHLQQPQDKGNPWGNYELIQCEDGKTRRIESGIFPLAHGVSGRVAKLRGLGNAIVPPLAAEFIKALLEAENLSP